MGVDHNSMGVDQGLDRHFNSRSVYKKNRFATLAEWRQLAAWSWRFLADRRLVRIR